MKFPISIKKKKLFIWYGNHWMNINLQILIHGGGLKGFKRFTYNWIKCMFGIHTIISYAGFRDDGKGRRKFTRWRACSYCHKEVNKNE